MKYWISYRSRKGQGYITCQVTTKESKVISAAPIMKWALGKNIHFVLVWVMKQPESKFEIL